ncbi:hypothetical protein B7463_g916, partial [Scytalidium lignicola]
MQSYNSLSVFPDVPSGLEALSAARDRLSAYIFSNGNLEMVRASVEQSEGLKSWSSSSSRPTGPFRDLITIDKILGVGGNSGEAYADGKSARAFKPARCVYEGLLSAVQADGERNADEELRGVGMGDMWLVTSNPFDVVGALNVGMRAAWVDRGGKGWVDGLAGVLGFEGPTVVVSGIGEVVERISGWEEGRRS